MRKHHSVLYFIEFVIIGGGFAFLLSVNMALNTQLWILSLILLFYMIIGLSHHRSHHDISLKVVLEYILISALIFALFVFLNIARL